MIWSRSSPTVPTWQDYGYSSADWPGYTVVVLDKTSPRCSAANWTSDLGTPTKPTVIDATACSGGLSQHPTSATTVTIGANIVVVASEIDLRHLPRDVLGTTEEISPAAAWVSPRSLISR